MYSATDTRLTTGGLPHSEIPGSKLVCQLPEAYRRLQRPSSPVAAKASTMCAYSLDHITPNGLARSFLRSLRCGFHSLRSRTDVRSLARSTRALRSRKIPSRYPLSNEDGGFYGAGYKCNTPILNEACASFGAFTTFQIVKEQTGGSRAANK